MGFAEKSWGSYRVLDVGTDSLTVKVTLNSGHGMNYHSHERRAGVWTVISGTGRVIVDWCRWPFKTAICTVLDPECTHRLK